NIEELGSEVKVLAEEIPATVQGTIPDGVNYVVMGTTQAQVEEKGKYAITIYRVGDLDIETDINLKTIDVSASYGKDYIISDDRYSTEVLEVEGTLLQQSGEANGLESSEDEYGFLSEISVSDNAIGGSLLQEDGETDSLENKNDENGFFSEKSVSDNTIEENSLKDSGEELSLARLKESQTGLPTRETTEDPDSEGLSGLVNMIVENGVINVGDYLDTSSSTAIHFDVGEGRKTVVFEVFEDGESEGNEMLQFNICDASEGTELAEPYMVDIMIKDDEPSEKSLISLSKDSYRAVEGKVSITVNRERAAYSMSTVALKVVGEGDKGVRELTFQPYVMEKNVELTFNQEKEEARYEVELYDLKGCEQGQFYKAEIIVPPANKAFADSGIDDTKEGIQSEDMELEALGDAPSAGDSIVIGGHNYKLAKGDSEGVLKIVSNENDQILGRKAPVQVGLYYLCKATDPWKWGYYYGDSASTSACGYEDGHKYGHLSWYSRLVWDKGGTGVGFLTSLRPFASYFLDYTSQSKYDSAQTSMTMMGKDCYSIGSYGVNKSLYTGNKNNVDDSGDKVINERTLMGPLRVTQGSNRYYGNKAHLDPGKIPYTDDESSIRINIDRTETGLTEPEAHIYGMVAMFKSISFSVSEPNSLSYLTSGGSTESLYPAIAKLPDRARRFYGESITFDIEAYDSDIKVPKGRLKGWEITPNGGTKFTVNREDVASGKVTYLSKDGRTFNINDQFIDELTSHGIEVNKGELNNEGYVMGVTAKPIFEFITVNVQILKSVGEGSFAASELCSTGEYLFHVGDTLNLSGVAKKGYVFSGYSIAAYKNYDDTQPVYSGDLINNPLNIKLTDFERYTLRPVFTVESNCIEIKMSEEAEKYFTVSGLVSQDELPEDLKGKKILKIDNRLSDADPVTQPVAGDAYEVRLLNSSNNDGSYRPVFTIENTGQKVNGYVADILAGVKASENVIKVDAEKVDTKEYRYFELNSTAIYSSSKLRAADGEKTSDPAVGITVRAAGTYMLGYNREKVKAPIVIRNSTFTDYKGKFSIKGISAIPGDVISVVFDNEDRQQVKYVKLPYKIAPVKSTFSIMVPDDDTKAMKAEEVTENACIINIDSMGMPIYSPRAPKIIKVDYSYDADPMRDTLKNFVELRPGENISISTYVDQSQGSVKAVRYLIYDSYGIKRELDTEKTEITTPLPTGDKNIYKATFKAMSDIKAGDTLYVQLISNEAKRVTYDDGSQVDKVFKEYARIDTGLTFGNLNEADDPQSFTIDISAGDYMSKFPLIGKVGDGLMAKTGALQLEKTLIDESNPTTSPFVVTVGLSVSVNNAKKQMKRLSELRNGKHKDAVEEEAEVKNIQEKVAELDVDAYANDQEQRNLERLIAGRGAEDRARITEKWSQGVRKRYQKELRKAQLPDSVASLNRQDPNNPPLDIKFAAVLQLFYTFDTEKNEFIFAGGQYLLGIGADYKRAWHYVVVCLPAYIAIEASGSFYIDGRFLTENTKTTYAQMKKAADISDITNLGLITLDPTISFKFMPGVGFYGIVGARGEVSVVGTLRYTFNSVRKGDKGGSYISVGGGIGFDALLFSFNLNLGKVEKKTGVFKTNSKLQSDESDEGLNQIKETKSLVPFYTEGEEICYLGAESSENESLENVGLTLKAPENIEEKVLVDNGAKYLRPHIVYGEGIRVLTYLSKNNGKANLVYSIDKGDGFQLPKRVDPEGLGTDSKNHMIIKDGKVYIAWTAADKTLNDVVIEEDGDNSEDIEAAKEALMSTNIKMSVYDISTDTMSEPILVTNDKFVNSDVMLCAEKNKVILYYYKKDIKDASTMNELVSHNSNYTTWAFKSYDTVNKKMDEDEEFITIVHPEITDPLVLNYYSESCKVKEDEWKLTAYSIDKSLNEGALELTNSPKEVDAEVWLEAKNITKGEDSTPLRIRLQSGNVGDIKINRVNEDTLITWISDSKTLNTLSVDYLLSPTSDEDEVSPLEHVINGDKDENGESYDIGVNSFTFGLDEDGAANITQYQIISGEDGNDYLFMIAPGEKEIETDEDGHIQSEQGIEIYAASYFKASSSDERSGWGDIIQLTNYKKAIDELTAAVDENHAATIIANIFDNTITEDGLKSEHFKLVELDCQPVSSLKIVDGPIMDEEDSYPIPGETVKLSFSVENDGLLPAKNYRIDFIQRAGETETRAAESILWSDDSDTIFPGDERDFNVDWTIPSGISDEELDNLEFITRVTELEYNNSSKEYGSDESVISLDLGHQLIRTEDAHITSGIELLETLMEIKDKIEVISSTGELTDEEEIDVIRSLSDKEIDTLGDLIQYSGASDLQELYKFEEEKINEDYWYAVVYVNNSGNITANKVKATLTRNAENAAKRELMGESELYEGIGPEELKALFIPIDPEKHELFNEYGVLDGWINITVDGKSIGNDIGIYSYTPDNVGIDVSGYEDGEVIPLKEGESLILDVVCEPYDHLSELIFTSKDPDVAVVSNEGKITATGVGSTVISVSDVFSESEPNRIEVAVKVSRKDSIQTLKDNTLRYDEVEDKDNVTLLKNGSYILEEGLEWSTSVKNAVTVNKRTNKLTPKKNTELTITKGNEKKTLNIIVATIKKSNQTFTSRRKSINLGELFIATDNLLPDVKDGEYQVTVTDKKGILTFEGPSAESIADTRLSDFVVKANGNKGSAQIAVTIGGKVYKATVKCNGFPVLEGAGDDKVVSSFENNTIT
nr:hypothetical protein [Lachnospiraceae bacterium]